MIYVGIDPGKDGALAWIDDAGAVSILPYEKRAYQNALEACAPHAVVCLEHVGAMPGQGVTSMFHFGESYGWLQGVLDTLELPYQLVRPQTWKREFGCSNKNESVAVCRRLFPGVSLRRTPQCRKDHDGMAEALLMAEYARRRLGGAGG